MKRLSPGSDGREKTVALATSIHDTVIYGRIEGDLLLCSVAGQGRGKSDDVLLPGVRWNIRLLHVNGGRRLCSRSARVGAWIRQASPSSFPVADGMSRRFIRTTPACGGSLECSILTGSQTAKGR